MIAPRAAEVISAYSASAGRVDGAPPPAWASEGTASEPVRGPRRGHSEGVSNIREKGDCERRRLPTEGWDAEVSPISPQVKPV